MFYEMKLERRLRLHPMRFHSNLHHTIFDHLRVDVEGKCDSRVEGFVVKVKQLLDIGEGVIDLEGFSMFRVRYEAIVFCPQVSQVLDAIVTEVHDLGFFALAGPLRVFVSPGQMGSGMIFEPQIPAYSWVDEDGSKHSFEKDDVFRVKLIQIKVDQNDIFAIGTIKGDWLG